MKISKNVFGLVVAASVSGILSTAARAADGPGAAAPAAPSAGKCVHNCNGYATCKGNGNNNCKGKNDCANQGLVPKECSSQKTEAACGEVKDKKKKEKMCSWYTT